MPLVNINVSNLIPPELRQRFAQREQVAARVVAELANAAREFWSTEAGRKLGSTASAYQQGIQRVELAGRKASIALTGMLPNMLEQGWDGGDMRETLCGPGARNRKQGADGSWYNTVPFRHQGPGTQGTAGSPIGSQFAPSPAGSTATAHPVIPESTRQAMARQVWRKAQQLGATWGEMGPAAPGTTPMTHWGGRLQAGLMPNLRPALTPVISLGGAMLGYAQHATDIYAGMVRQQQTYEHATQSQYTTFRRISTNSTTGWYHPGIQARHLAQATAKHVSKIAGAAWRNALRGPA